MEHVADFCVWSLATSTVQPRGWHWAKRMATSEVRKSGMAMQPWRLPERNGYATSEVAGTEWLRNLGGCRSGMAMQLRRSDVPPTLFSKAPSDLVEFPPVQVQHNAWVAWASGCLCGIETISATDSFLATTLGLLGLSGVLGLLGRHGHHQCD